MFTTDDIYSQIYVMKSLPVVEHYKPNPDKRELEAVDHLARQLRLEYPELTVNEGLKQLTVGTLEDAPSLYIDDMSDIALLDRGRDEHFLQDRARLRAGDGDYVVSCAAFSEDFERYCREQLGLGACTWLHPRRPRYPMRLAAAVLEDHDVCRRLVDAFSKGELVYIHPHMGTLQVWELAVLIRQRSGAAVKVIAPPPLLTRWVNNKILFAHTVSRLFGESLIPPTNEAFNLATLAERVERIKNLYRFLVIKVPNSAGGNGNMVIETERFRHRSLNEIWRDLRDILRNTHWDEQPILMVGCWESEIISSPSAQLWIPPASSGLPVVEGVYEQILEGPMRSFAGSRPARFPGIITERLVTRCWLLGRLFQRLGYVGRCSFDLLLVGDRVEDSRLEFVECNGRWGGTSIPMTLMNRLFGDWTTQPYATKICKVDGLDRFSFGELLNLLKEDLFNAQTMDGRIILFNPGRLAAQSAIDLIAMGKTISDAEKSALYEFPERLRRLRE